MTDTAFVDVLEMDDTGRNGLLVLVEKRWTMRVPLYVPPPRHKLTVVIVAALAAFAWNSMAAREFGEKIVIGEPGDALQPLPMNTSDELSTNERAEIKKKKRII